VLLFDEQRNLDDEWYKWYAKEVSAYPMGEFSILDNSFNMKTCVDIGASIGGFSILASKYFEKVIAFEPSKTVFSQGIKNILGRAINNIDIYNLAVSNKTGEIVNLSCIIDPESGKFYSHNASTVWNEGEETEKALTINLKKIYELAETDFIDYLKVDCEGSEWDILANQDLSKVGLICAELHKPEKNASSEDFISLRNRLIQHMSIDGFKVCLYSENNIFARNTRFNMPCVVCDREALAKISTKNVCNCSSCQAKRSLQDA
jgi:FkbM family methyltransferase